MAVALIAKCFAEGGLRKCVCAIARQLEPHWLKVNDDEYQKCQKGNAINLIMDVILRETGDALSGVINDQIVRPINDVIPGDGPLDEACFDLGSRTRGPERRAECANYPGFERPECESPPPGSGDEAICYYDRVHTICDSEEHTRGYEELFNLGYNDTDDLRQELMTAFGASYSDYAPAITDLLEIAERDPRDFSYPRDICQRNYMKHEITIDMAITACLFAALDGLCSEVDSEDVETFLRSIEWKLPDVRFDYTVHPPPPPPFTASSYAFAMEEDGEGVEEMHSKMNQWYPTLQHTAMSSIGSRTESYGPEAVVTPHQLTKAFLATRGFHNPDGLAARMVAARHTNRWRYACAELVKYLDDYASAAYGSEGRGGESGSFSNPQGYSSRYDRNKLVYWALLYESSYDHDDARRSQAIEPLRLYSEMCTDHCSYRVPVPERFAEAVHSTAPSDGDPVECVDLGPLASYGSLRQLQSRYGGASCGGTGAKEPRFGEDHTVAIHCDGLGSSSAGKGVFFHNDVVRRAKGSPFQYKQTVLCNPNVPALSLRHVVGNPRIPVNGEIRDSTGLAEGIVPTQTGRRRRQRRLFLPIVGALIAGLVVGEAEASSTEGIGGPEGRWNDLVVTAEQRGESEFYDEYNRFSLMRMVYVTSSHDPKTPPGVYRLLDGPFFPSSSCVELPDQVCGTSVDARGVQRSEVVNPNGAWPTPGFKHLDELDGLDGRFVTGRRALLRSRCSQHLANYRAPVEVERQQSAPAFPDAEVGCRPENAQPYMYLSAESDARGIPAPCIASQLSLVEDDQLTYGGLFMDRLTTPPPRPEPPPPPPPPKPPSPPAPLRPPTPPLHQDPDAVRATLRTHQARFCDTVISQFSNLKPLLSTTRRRATAVQHVAGLLPQRRDALRGACRRAPGACPRVRPRARAAASAATAAARRDADHVDLLPPAVHSVSALSATAARATTLATPALATSADAAAAGRGQRRDCARDAQHTAAFRRHGRHLLRAARARAPTRAPSEHRLRL